MLHSYYTTKNLILFDLFIRVEFWLSEQLTNRNINDPKFAQPTKQGKIYGVANWSNWVSWSIITKLISFINAVKFKLVSASNVYCKYFYVYGPDWQQVAGLEEG